MSIAKDISSKTEEEKKAILGSAFVASVSSENIATRTRSRSMSTDDGTGTGGRNTTAHTMENTKKRKRSK